jgi:hypothetical protein
LRNLLRWKIRLRPVISVRTFQNVGNRRHEYCIRWSGNWSWGATRPIELSEDIFFMRLSTDPSDTWVSGLRTKIYSPPAFSTPWLTALVKPILTVFWMKVRLSFFLPLIISTVSSSEALSMTTVSYCPFGLIAWMESRHGLMSAWEL